MKRYAVFLLAILVAGLAVGCGGDRDQGPTTVEIRNADLKVGDPAPDFDLYDSTGAKVRLSDYVGQKNVVLAFYPAAWTPV